MGEGTAKYKTDRTWIQARNATRVYSGRWSMPSPSRWGVDNSAYWTAIPRIPFATPWVYRGGHYGLVMDFKFHGGRLSNSASWGTKQIAYYLDGVRTAPDQLARVTGTNLGAANSCNDSAITSHYPASTTVAASVTGDGHILSSRRNQLRFVTTSVHTAPSATVVQALAVNGHPRGYAVGANCQRLFVNTTAFIGLSFLKSDQTGRAVSLLDMPFKSKYAGVTIYGQSAWIDSKTGAFSLTRASRLAIPPKPPTIPLRKALWNSSRTAFQPNALPDSSPTLQPLPLLVYR